MSIILHDPTIFLDGTRISFWITSGPQYDRCGLVVDVESGAILGRIPGSGIVTPIHWSVDGRGVFAEIGVSNPSELKLINSRDYSLDSTFELPVNVSEVYWVGHHQLGLLEVQPVRTPNSVPPATNLRYFDLSSGSVSTTTGMEGATGPIQVLSDEVWCVTRSDGGVEVRSLMSGRLVWASSRGRFLDDVSAIDPAGRLLVLHTHVRPLALLADSLRHPRSLGTMMRALAARIAVPTRVSVVDPTKHASTWVSTPGRIVSAAFGNERVAWSVMLGSRDYGVFESRLGSNTERMLLGGRERLNVVGETPKGWLILVDNQSLAILDATGHVSILFSE